VNMARREFSIGCLGVGIAERSILVVNPPAVLHVYRDISFKFVQCSLSPIIDMPLGMILVVISSVQSASQADETKLQGLKWPSEQSTL